MNKTVVKKGECVVYYESLTNIMVTKWKDKKDVHMMLTFVNDRETQVRRAGKDKMIPSVVDIYNCSMGGVDKSDQMMTLYNVERKHVKKWYKKIFYHLINQCAFNAHILHKVKGGRLTPLKFRQELLKSLFEKYPTHEAPVGQHGRSAQNDTSLRLTGRHFPAYVKSKGEKEIPTGCNEYTKGKRKPRRRCVVCPKRKDTRFICETCDVGLCAVPCFKNYHTMKKYQ